MSILTETKPKRIPHYRKRLYQDKADYLAANRARNSAEIKSWFADKTLCEISAAWKGEAFKCSCCENKGTAACPERVK